jgi:hypothetical protein
MFCRFEFPHVLFSSSCGLVCVLGAMVEPLVLPMFDAWQDFTFRRTIALQFISDDDARDVVQSFEQLAEKSLSRLFVASALHEDIQDVAILIPGSPEGMLLAADRENHLIHILLVATTRAATAQFIGRGLTKCEAPLPHLFIGHDDPVLRVVRSSTGPKTE